MTVIQKQAVSRVVFDFIIIVLISLKLFKIHGDFAPNPPKGVMLTKGLLVLFLIYLFVALVKFVKEAVVVFKKD
ncbi:MAG: hypothetical protein GY858_06255 [Candidatus Omnitrophica bacterium]|nr:hypothetical protein [Candidatus Omnitrophota bacterium]